MMRHVAIATLLALPALVLAAPAAAYDPDLPPLVGVCVKGVTGADCFRHADACVGFSYQVPQCVDAPCYPVDCVSVQSPEDPIPMDCMPVYREYDFGIVRYVSRDSCHAELYVLGEQVYPLTP